MTEEQNPDEPDALAALEILFEMSRYASPAESGYDQGHAETAKEVLGNVIAVLRTAGIQFRRYEKLHLEKSPPDSQKAFSNRAYAELCENALNGASDFDKEILSKF